MTKAPYTHYTMPEVSTSISRHIPGRKTEMVRNLAGGYAFKAEDFTALRRWLLTGSTSNAFYQSKEDLTELNIEILEKCVNQDPRKVGEEVLYASDHGINNHTPILALVYLSSGGFGAKKVFREIFSDVVRTASHLYEFFHYTKQLRGMGQTIHKAVKSWFFTTSNRDLEYQFLKYQNRYGWTGRDVLRTIRPVPATETTNAIYSWMLGKYELLDELPKMQLNRLYVYERMKTEDCDEKDVLKWIDEYRLTHEMIPSNIERTKDVWNALYQKMPLTATIRNLGSLTTKEILNIDNLNILEQRLSKENLKRGRIHPLVVASAYAIYSGGGSLGKSKLIWSPIPRVADILEDAIENAFESIEPTNKQFYLALDVSGSMFGGYAYNTLGLITAGTVGNLWMCPGDVAGIMALATIKSEKNYFVGCFSDNFKPLPKVIKKMSFRDMFLTMRDQKFGGTNAASAYKYAIDNNIYTDVFVMYTDGESWMGGHPTLRLKEYREKINPNAKAIYITLTPYGDKATLVDPKDKMSYDIAGFSSETVKLIQMIVNGDV